MKKHLAILMFVGLFTFSSFNAFAQPANDDCSTAISLTVGSDEGSAVPVSGTTLSATQSTAPTSVCSGSWLADDVWYSFTTGATPPVGGVSIKVTPGSLSLLGMAVYASCGAAEAPIVCFSDCGVTEGTSIPFLAANTTYYIRMWSGCGGTTNATTGAITSGTFDIIAYNNPAPLTDVVLWGNNPGEGDFDGGLNNWTTNSLSAGADWVWEADATSNQYGNTIVSQTAANGAMLFDAADFTLTVTPQPTQPYPVHMGELISPVIDCSTFGEFACKFYQNYNSLNGDTYFSFSTDGGVTFSDLININDDIAANTATPTPSIKRIPMPGAGGSSQVVVKFTADIDFYDWLIDDVQFIEKVNNDLAIANGFVSTATSYTMPIASVDTLRFLADVANIGGNDQYNVMLDVNVVRGSDNTSVFTASNSYGTMPSGDTTENQLFTDFYLPPASKETYTVTYTLSSDSTDALPDDNSFTFDFEVVDSLFAKEPAGTRNIAPSGASNDFTYGSTFYVYGGNDGVTNHRYVTGLGFGVGNPAGAVGEVLTLYLEKPAAGSTVFDANDDGVIQSTEREVAAFGSYTVTGNETANEVFYVAVNDFQTGGLHALEENTLYSVVVNFAGSDATKEFFLAGAQSAELNYGAADLAAGLRGVERYSQLLDVGNSGDYSTGGFIGNPVAAVRLQYTEYLVYTNNVELEDDAFTIFPNPAVDHITATIELEEQADNARFVIYNVAGQVLETRNMNNIQNEQVQFNLNNYASGTYFISIDTDKGHSIKRFVVNK
jgi:hypothetical protein